MSLRGDNPYQNFGGIVRAAVQGDIPAIQQLRAHGVQWSDRACEAAAYHGQLEVLTHLHEDGCPWDERTFEAAARLRYSNLPVLVYLLENGCPWNAQVFSAAAEGGSVYNLAFLNDNGCPKHHDAVYKAIANNRVDVLDFFERIGVELKPRHATWAVKHFAAKALISLADRGVPLCCDDAAKYGNLELLMYMHDTRNRPLTIRTLRYGIVRAKDIPTHDRVATSMEIVEYLCDSKCPWDARVMNDAVRVPDLAMVTYLHDQGCPWDATTSEVAATVGDKGILQYLRENGCPDAPTRDPPVPLALDVLRVAGKRVTAHTMTTAAEEGDLPVVQWLVQIGAKWNEQTLTAAVSSGRLALVKYLHEQGCPKDSGVYAPAIANNDLAMVNYLSKNGCFFNERVVRQVIESGHLSMLKCLLHYTHTPMTPEMHALWMARAVESGHLDIVKYLYQRRFDLDARLYMLAGREHHLDILEWLAANKCPRPDGALAAAAAWGDVRILRFLDKQGIIFDQQSYNTAMSRGWLGIIRHLDRTACQRHPRSYVHAIAADHLNVIEYVSSCGFRFRASDMLLAARYGHLDIVRFLRKRGCAWDTDVFTAAAGGSTPRHLQVLRYLKDERCPYDARACWEVAATHDVEEILHEMDNDA